MPISNATLTQIADLCDRLVSRWDAFESARRLERERKDAEKRQRAQSLSVHGEGKPDSRAPLNIHGGPENPRRRDADFKSTLPDLANEARRLDSLAPARLSMIDEPEYRAVQVRYDDAHEAALGRRAPPPRGRESLFQYTYRLAEDLLPHCPHFNDIKSLTGVGLSAFRVMEPNIIADAIAEAAHPTMIPDGQMIEKTRVDRTGRHYQEFYGSAKAWMDQFKPDRKRVFGIRTKAISGYYPNS